jgi:DNA-binding NarL/FixJ family response regulator
VSDTDGVTPDVARRVVLIVDDHRLMAEALERALAGRGFCCHVADLESPQGIVDQALRICPDLVLLDLDLGPIDGLQLVRPLRVAGHRVLVLTGCEDPRRLGATVALGSVGWVLKDRPFEQVVEAAEAACRDRPLLSSQRRDDLATAGWDYVQRDRATQARMSTLTQREQEVLNGIVRGDTAQEIADRLLLSLGTVRTHIRSVLSKLGVSSQLAAVAVAMQWAASKRGLDRADLLASLCSIA